MHLLFQRRSLLYYLVKEKDECFDIIVLYTIFIERTYPSVNFRWSVGSQSTVHTHQRGTALLTRSHTSLNTCSSPALIQFEICLEDEMSHHCFDLDSVPYLSSLERFLLILRRNITKIPKVDHLRTYLFESAGVRIQGALLQSR